jgi:hypothetical protein
VATVNVTETPTTLDVTGAAELAVTNTGSASVYVNTQRLRPGQRGTFDTSRPLQVTTQPGQTSTVDTTVAVASGQGGGQSGTYARTLGPASGTDDTATLNALLATGGHFIGTPGQTYKVAGLVVPSNTYLDLRGCAVQMPTGATGNIVKNAACTPTATASDAAITTGSNVVTTAIAATVGQTVVIAGAGGTGNGPLVANVSAVGAGTLTLTTLDGRPANATATVTAATVSAYTRDKNITIVGGAWDRGTADAPTNPLKHSLFFRHVDGLTLDVDSLASAAGLYGISAGDVTQARLGIGTANTFKDGIHVTGPAFGVECIRLGGATGDDSLSLTANDYTGTISDVGGDIIGVRWGLINTKAGQSNTKIMAGAGRFIDDVVGGTILGTSVKHGCWIGEDVLNPGTTGGTYGTIDTGLIASTTLNPSSGYSLYLSAPAATSVRSKIRLSAASGYAIGTAGTSPATLRRCHIDLDVDGGAQILNVNAASLTIDSLILDGRYDLPSGSNASCQLNQGTVTELDGRLRSTYPAPASSSASLFNQQGPAVVTYLRHSGISSGGGPIYIGKAGVNGPTIILSGRVTGSSRVVSAFAPTTVYLANPVLDGQTQQLFRVATGPLTLQGRATIVNTTQALILRAAAESVRVNGGDLPVDVSTLTPTDGDEATNTNAALGCGTGRVIYNTTAARWKNLYTGVTN